ncbi:MAG: MOSC domain-containing protein [Fimbriimonadaceae bacterium]|nr:MOSC domain-containing protein [Fimbriimonadaceae bacterium]
MNFMAATVVSVQVGQPKWLSWKSRSEPSAIAKSRVEGRVKATAEGLAGDRQGDPVHHGGEFQAVYAYSLGDYAWWHESQGVEVEPPLFGENLTIRQLDLRSLRVGQRVRIGTATLAATVPRIPCWKLGAVMGDEGFVERFRDAGRPGAYLRVVEEGEIGAGDELTLEPALSAGPTLSDLFRIRTSELHRASELLELPGLHPSWQAWAARVTTAP